MNVDNLSQLVQDFYQVHIATILVYGTDHDSIKVHYYILLFLKF